jgi:sirohydrochlorin cobaltochelatase
MTHYDYTILLAHGSRDARWTEPFEAITSGTAEHQDRITLAFMELSSPSLARAISDATHAGAKNIAVLPLFFAAGKHLREDVPAMILEIAKTSAAKIDLLPAIGEHPAFQNAIRGIIENLLTEHEL